MDQDNTPDWIKKHNQESADQKARVDAAERRRQQAAVSLRTAGPDFWQRFVNRVVANANALHTLNGEELVGNVSHSLPGGMTPEHNCYIQVNRQSVRFGPELSKMNLWFAPGSSKIRCWYQDQEMVDIQLGVRGGSVCAALAGDLLTAEQLADHIVEWMAERVKAPKRRAS